MKKIMLYIDSMAPSGGIERVNANLFNNFVDKYDVTFLVKNTKKSFYELNDNIKIESLNIPFSNNMNYSKITRIIVVFLDIIFSIYKLRKYFKNSHFDYIFTVNPQGALQIYLSNKNTKIIATEHGSIKAYNKIYSFIQKKIYPKCYKLIVPTTFDETEYNKIGIQAICIPHLSTYKVAENNFDNKSYNVLNVGRLTSDKQQLLLLDIWNDIKKENLVNDRWKLIIIGDGEEKNKIISKVQDYSLESSVELVDATKEINKYYRNSRIFAFTSRMEGFGMVLLEAMSFGNACISFDCPSGPRDIIKNEVNGYLIECYDKVAYKDKLVSLMNDEEKNEYMSYNAKQTVKEWNNDDILNRWYTILK